MSEEKPAVWIQNAYKRYTPSSVVLRGLNMKVMEGTIYGLLGPSGCGKTTLLNCVVGQRSLDSGNIYISVKRKVEVGFMPQEIALNLEFTITEVFYYYGRIFGMSVHQIQNRSEELVKFLELPTMEKVIAQCSGGQQRRISLAVTLLNNPKLLILDEPTVGVDPVLCHSIWEHFIEIVRKYKKTIIITTHYIEEAKNAHCIGLMREGVLLAEEPPFALLRQYNSDSLEEVFLTLSQKQEHSEAPEVQLPYPKISPNPKPLQSDKMINVERLKAQLLKNFNWTKRNWQVTAFVILLPALLLTIVGQITSQDGGDFPVGDVPLAMVNKETDQCANTTAYLRLSSECKPTRPISCRYIDNLSQVFNLINCETESEAINAVQKSQAFGYVAFPANFSRNMMVRVREQTAAPIAAIEGSTIEVSFDMTDFGKCIRSTRELGQRIIDMVQDICDECGYSRKMADIPMTIMEKIYDSKELLLSVLPSYFCSVAFFTVMLYTSTALLMERTSGSFERTLVAGLTTAEIIIALVVIEVWIMTMQNIISFTVLYVIYEFTMKGSILVAFILILLVQSFAISYGFFLAAMVSTEKNVTYVGIFSMLSLFMLTGSIWPVEGLHWTLKPLSDLIPVTKASRAFYSISLRGWSIAKYQVYIGIISPILGTLFFSILTYLGVTFNFGTLS